MVVADHDRIDFPALAAALLDRAEVLVPLWLPAGRKLNGRWYVGDFDGAEGKSANVNLRTGTWIDNGRSGDKGGDLISLYGRLKGLSNMAAARELMRDNGWMQHQVQPPPARQTRPRTAAVEWLPIHPVPDGAPDYRTQWAHYARGVPGAHWEYRGVAGELLGVVCRFDKSDGSKDVQPLSYCQGSDGRREWRYKAFTQPRPLYGLWRLVREPQNQPLAVVVEGEKKADRLFDALGGAIPVLGWPGGCKVVHLADWSPLRGYRVLAWPDADAQRDKASGQLLPAEAQPGLQAMRKLAALLAEMQVPVRIVDTGAPGTRADGWDAADAVADGWTREQLLAFMRNLLPDQPDSSAAADADEGGSTTAPAAQAEGGRPARWRDAYIMTRGAIRECVPNVMLLLHRHPAWQGVLGFDEFSQRIVKRRPAPYDDQAGTGTQWVDVDDTRAAAWIARQEGFVPSAHMVAEAAMEAAHAQAFHPVLEYLRGLQHDGVERLDHWLVDLFGTADTPYVRLVGRYFLIGMCMRVLQPGCKFDYCLVLEGPQGRRKSSALRALAGEWFSDIELDLTNKDAMSNIRGKWLHEFAEMGSLARAEASRQKSFLSRQVDEFRPTYGRREIRCPRQTAFAGSTNEWAWNKDPTGGRRFWPVEVGDTVNTDGLAAVRDQLFAEAFAAAQAGDRYWPDADQQRQLFDPEQLARESPDAFVEILGSWIENDPQMKPEFTLTDACMSGLKLDAKSLTKDVQTRVGIALRKLGCERVERRSAVNRFVYKRPQRNAASSQTDHGAAEGPEVPF